MKNPVQISFRGLPASPAVEAVVREKAQKLERFCDDIMSCRIMIDSPHRHHRKGKHYHVRIDLTVPGREIVVNRDPPEDPTHEDLYVAIRDAFDSARRRLQDYVRIRQGHVKAHRVPRPATVLRVYPSQGYGFLQAADGREVYFHRNSLVDLDFERLHPGTEVQYVEETGDEGPQAATVTKG